MSRLLQRALALARANGLPPATAQNNAFRSIATGVTQQAPMHIEDEPYCRQRQLILLGTRVPYTSPDAWLASNALLIGDVEVYEKVSVWYGAVLRGDLNAVRVGSWSNVQDRTVIHAARTSPTGLPAACKIGMFVTIGSGCTLRSCTIQNQVIIGDRSILMEGSFVEDHAVLAPGTVLPPGRLVPSKQLWGGNPARFVRNLTKDEINQIPEIAESMYPIVDIHYDEDVEESFAYVDADKVKERLQAFPAFEEYCKRIPISKAGVVSDVPGSPASLPV